MCVMGRRNRKQVNPGRVIIPVGHPKPPEPHEEDAAKILARHYQTTVEFLIPVDDYKRKSADIVMLGVQWEIKTPKGDSKYTIQKQFRRASKQAKNIIIDTRRTKLKYTNIENQALFEWRKRPVISKIILIDKFEKVVELRK